MQAGKLNRRITIQQLVDTSNTDEYGQVIREWDEFKKLWANPKGETGLGSIRSNANVPSSIARYSFMIRKESSIGIDAGMRIILDGMYFDIKGVTHDLEKNDRSYLICEQGGNNG